ncbi:MAG: hypothetical protein V4710_24625 [Verrucomicrobiota bacterium]
MAMAKQHRRNLVHEGRTYEWFVKEDHDTSDLILSIQNEAKTLSVQYILGQKEEVCFVTVYGSDFFRLDPSSNWRRFECPRFDPHGVITPKGVAGIIQWCLSPSEKRVPVNLSEGIFWYTPRY